MDTEIALMAESNDGVSWTPAAMGGRCAQLPEVSNCVMVDGHEEFSVVFDDALHSPPSERLKLVLRQLLHVRILRRRRMAPVRALDGLDD